MHFEHTQLLYLIPLADGLLLSLLLWARRARIKSAIDYAPVKVLKAELGPKAFKRPRTVFLTLLALAMLTLIMLALANPYEVERKMKKYAVGVIVVDISGSMEAQDMGFGKTRLDAAKEAIYDLLANLEPGQFQLGIVAFSGVPYPVASLTSDMETLRSALESLRQIWSSTNIGDSLMGAFNWLNSSGATNGFIILMTDGVWYAGADPVVVARRIAESSNIGVYTVAIGGRGAWVRGEYVKPPDIELLKQIAYTTGAKFYTADNYLDLVHVVSKDVPQDAGLFELREISQFHKFLCPVPLLLLTYVLVSERRFGLLP